MNFLIEKIWSPYIVGAGIGILSWFTFLLSNKAIGCSTSFVRSAGMLEKIISKDRVRNNQYYKQYKPEIDWGWLFVLGILIGSFISAYLSGSFDFRWIPQFWQLSFGNSIILKTAVSFLGGIIMGIGARWAGGCTSGHGISGGMQLALSSWIAIICFFAGGIITAYLIF